MFLFVCVGCMCACVCMTPLQPGELQAITGQQGCYGDQWCQRGATSVECLFVRQVFLFLSLPPPLSLCQSLSQTHTAWERLMLTEVLKPDAKYPVSEHQCFQSLVNMTLEYGTDLKAVISQVIVQLPVLNHAHSRSLGCVSQQGLGDSFYWVHASGKLTFWGSI